MQYTKEDLSIFLQSNAEYKYKQFFSRLTNTQYYINGIRVPILKKQAKLIAKSSNIEEFLSYKTLSYEQLMLKGLVIAYSKENDDKKMQWIDSFVEEIDDWGVCDTCSSAIKIASAEYLSRCIQYAKSPKEFVARWGIVNILAHYKDNKNAIIEIYNNILAKGYYVDMALAWLFQVCVANNVDMAKELLKCISMSDNVKALAVRKIKDSYKISREDKELFVELLKNNTNQQKNLD